jgi:quercetin dioxygenase-like cupin family protein
MPRRLDPHQRLAPDVPVRRRDDYDRRSVEGLAVNAGTLIRVLEEVRIVRRITLLAVVGCLGVLALVMDSGTGQASPGSGFTRGPIHRATIAPHHFDSSDYKLFQKNSEDVVVFEVTIVPGGGSGWHSHPGPSYVLVTSGTASLYEAADNPTCQARNFGPGEGFVELPGDVHFLRNNGTVPLVTQVVFLDVPAGGAFRIEAPIPGNCPF